MKKSIAGKKTTISSVSKPTKHKISTSISFPMVGIGASAGGLDG